MRTVDPAVLDLRDKVKRCFDAMQMSHLNFSGLMREVTDMIMSNRMDDSSCTDYGWMCHKMGDILDEMRKESQARALLISRLLAARAGTMVTDDGMPPTFRGDLATATPSAKVFPRLPERGTPEFRAAMEWLGISGSRLEDGQIKLDFKGVQDMLTKLSEEGKPLPPGLDQVTIEPQVTFRARKVKSHEQQEK